jgi:hypothetical protein
MAFKVTVNGNNIQSSVCEIIADTDADIADLPTDVGVGSDCIVLESSSVYMLGSDHVWHEL